MSKKQRIMLVRILLAAALLLVLNFVPAAGLTRFVLYLAPYLIIGYDILRKAFKGIRNRQVFDESFLMAVATIGAIALALYEGSGDYTEAVAVMLFYQIGEWFQSYAVGKSRPEHQRADGHPPGLRPMWSGPAGWSRWTRTRWRSARSLWSSPVRRCPLTAWWWRGPLRRLPLISRSVLPRSEAAVLGTSLIRGLRQYDRLLKIRTIQGVWRVHGPQRSGLWWRTPLPQVKSEDFISKFARVYTPAVLPRPAPLALAVLPAPGAPAERTWVLSAAVAAAT